VGEEIHVSGGEDETAAELKGMVAEFLLAEAGGASAAAGGGVIAAEEMEQIGGSEAGDAVGFAIFVDEKGERDARLLAEDSGVAEIAQADGGTARALGAERRFIFAQPGDVLAAEDSTVVAEKDQDGGGVGPQAAELHRALVAIG